MTTEHNDQKALLIFKKIIRNRNATSNDGVQCIQPNHVTMDESQWLRKEGYTMTYNEYVTNGLPQPNNTICKDGIVVWEIQVKREERKRGGCYRMLMPTFTNKV